MPSPGGEGEGVPVPPAEALAGREGGADEEAGPDALGAPEPHAEALAPPLGLPVADGAGAEGVAPTEADGEPVLLGKARVGVAVARAEPLRETEALPEAVGAAGPEAAAEKVAAAVPVAPPPEGLGEGVPTGAEGVGREALREAGAVPPPVPDAHTEGVPDGRGVALPPAWEAEAQAEEGAVAEERGEGLPTPALGLPATLPAALRELGTVAAGLAEPAALLLCKAVAAEVAEVGGVGVAEGDDAALPLGTVLALVAPPSDAVGEGDGGTVGDEDGVPAPLAELLLEGAMVAVGLTEAPALADCDGGAV